MPGFLRHVSASILDISGFGTAHTSMSAGAISGRGFGADVFVQADCVARSQGLEEPCWGHRQYVVQVDRAGCVQPCLSTCPVIRYVFRQHFQLLSLVILTPSTISRRIRPQSLPSLTALSWSSLPDGHESQQQNLNELSYLSITSFRFARDNHPTSSRRRIGQTAANPAVSLSFDLLS